MEKRIYQREKPFRSKTYKAASGKELIEISVLTEGIVLLRIENREKGADYRASIVLLDSREETGMNAEDLFYAFVSSSLKDYTGKYCSQEHQEEILERLAQSIINLNINVEERIPKRVK